MVIPKSWLNCRVVPGWIVSVTPELTVTSHVTIYGLPAGVSVVLLEIAPHRVELAGARARADAAPPMNARNSPHASANAAVRPATMEHLPVASTASIRIAA